MKVFLKNLKIVSVIMRKEEITENTYLITDEEEIKIKRTIELDGDFWEIDKWTIGCSGEPLSADHKWNTETKQWEICKEKVQARINQERNEKLKELEILHAQQALTGVCVNGKWFSTSQIARLQYDELVRAVTLDLFDDVELTTLDNETVQVDLDFFKQINKAILLKSKKDTLNVKMLTEQINNSDTPLLIDLSDGWSDKHSSYSTLKD